jgi:hypothetical protein
MNERIQYMISSLNEEVGISYWTNEDKIKFAELIVRECAKVLSQVSGGYDSAVFYKNSRTLRQHFGIEE